MKYAARLLLGLIVALMIYHPTVWGAALPAENRGYFTDRLDDDGGFVWDEGIPKSAVSGAADSAAQRNALINWIHGRYVNGNAQQRTGAEFIIQTMRVSNGNFDRDRPSAADIDDWADKVREFPGVINFDRQNYSYSRNTYYQGTNGGANPNDDAFYYGAGSQTPEGFIVFQYGGQDRYVLKRNCANPIGSMLGLPEPDHDPSGAFVLINCTELRGWARDPEASGDALTIVARVTRISTGTTKDVVYAPNSPGRTNSDYAGEPGSDRYYFTITYASLELAAPSDQYRVQLFARNITPSGGTSGSQELANSPRTVGPCLDYELTPQVSITSGNGPIVNQGESVGLRFSVRNDGTVSNPTSIAVKFYDIPPSGTFNQGIGQQDNVADNCDPRYQSGSVCAVNVHAQGGVVFAANATQAVHTLTASTNGKPPGSLLCYMLAIDPPTESSTNPRNRWSAPICIEVGKRPNLTVRYGDLSVGATYRDASGSCPTPNVSNAKLRGSVTDIGGVRRGSTAELGVFSLGEINSFGSYNTVNTTNDDGLDKRLLFGNEKGQTLGYFRSPNNSTTVASPQCHNDAFAHFQRHADKNTNGPLPITSFGGDNFQQSVTYTDSSTNVLIGDGSPLTVPKGTRQVIYSKGIVSILQNITYEGGNYNSIDEIPQLVILAEGDVRIHWGNVTRIDAIIATKGNLNTCYRANPKAEITTSNLVCNSQLEINGPVATGGSIKAYKVYYDPNSPASNNDKGEIFKLRPDFAWAEYQRLLEDDTITTLNQREAPPRF